MTLTEVLASLNVALATVQLVVIAVMGFRLRDVARDLRRIGTGATTVRVAESDGVL